MITSKTSVLAIKLYANDLISKLASGKLQAIDISGDIFLNTEEHPYGDFLNDCIKFTPEKYNTLVLEIINDLKNNEVQTPSKEVLKNIENYRAKTNNMLDNHFVDTVENEYVELVSTMPTKCSSLRVSRFNLLLGNITFPMGKDMIDILSLYERTPFITLSEEDKKYISNKIKEHECFDGKCGNLFVDNLSQITFYIVNHMRENNIYIHQCASCGDWFAISEVKKSLLCGGTTCRHNPKLSSSERYKEKLRLLPYRDAFDKEYNYWYLRKRRQTLPEPDFTRWYNDAKIRLAMVETGVLDEESFVSWLLECRNTYGTKNGRKKMHNEFEEYKAWRNLKEGRTHSEN